MSTRKPDEIRANMGRFELDPEYSDISRLRTINAELLYALEAFSFFPCQGDDCTDYPAGLCPGCHVRAVIKKANK